MKYLHHLSACAALSLLAGCASDLSETPAQSGGLDEPIELPGPGGEAVNFKSHSAGYYQASVDGSGDHWIYLDLQTQTQTNPRDPDNSTLWDIAVKGVDIKLNGGVSGHPPSAFPVLAFADKVEDGSVYPWESVDAAPPASAVSYQADIEGDDSRGGQSGYVFSRLPEADESASPLTGAGDYGWYHYSGHLAGSQITPRENVAYIVRTVECRYISLRMTGYSDDSGADKHPQFDLQEIAGPACSAGEPVSPLGKVVFSHTPDGVRAQVDASDEEAWVYLDLGNALQVAPNDPAADASWDIALKRTDIQMNGGSSGSQDVALYAILRGDWDRITTRPDDAEFIVDETEALAFVSYPEAERGAQAACGDINGDFGWYYYSGFCAENGGVHSITPRDVVYLLRGRNGQYWKLRMLSYYDEAGSSAQPSFEFAVID